MNADQHAQKSARKSRWGRRLLILVVVGGLLAAVAATQIWYMRHSGEAKWLATLAELDRADPGWRWDEIQKARANTAEPNSASQIVLVTSLMPPNWWNDGRIHEVLQELGPEISFSTAQAEIVESELGKVLPAIENGRKLAELPNGRFELQLGPNPLDLLFNHVSDVRQTTVLLGYDAMHQAHRNEFDSAVASVHAGLNVSRTMSDEPTLISQLVRIACRSIPLRRLERVLAQGEASEGALAKLQQAIEDDEADPLYLFAVRGERAYFERVHNALDSNALSVPEFAGSAPSSGKYQIGPIDFEEVAAIFLEEGVSGQFADLLRALTETIEIATTRGGSTRGRGGPRSQNGKPATIRANPDAGDLQSPRRVPTEPC